MYNFEIEDIEEPQPLDDDEKTILQYITQHPGMTEYKIATEMDDNGICARATTHKKLRGLVERGFVEDRLHKANGFHRYYRSNKNDFSFLYDELLRIKNLVAAMFQSVCKLVKEDNPLELDVKFIDSYVQTVTTMLNILLFQIFFTKFSNVDAQTLYTIFLTVLVNLNGQSIHGSANLFTDLESLLIGKQNLERVMKELSRTATSKKSVLNIQVLNDLGKEIDHFDKDVVPIVRKFLEST